ncbi:MAG: DegV family protein [Acutalibacteraceae bacterium]
MNKVKIITDSCSDLSGELLTKYDIDYAKMTTVCEGVQQEASLLWEYYSPKELYDKIRNGIRVTTTQVPPEEFTRIFDLYINDYDIVYIGCSTKQSGSVNTAAVIAKQYKEKYPDSSIYCIDSLNASIGEGMLAIKAAEMRDEGKSAKEIFDSVSAMRNNVREFITVHTLEYLRRCGRVKATAAFFGNLMGVKPILISDANGVQTPVKKVKGRKNSFAEIVNLMKENITDSENQTIYLVHADCDPAEIEALKNETLSKIKCKDVLLLYIGPIIGASVGPDAIGLFAFGTEVTYAV